MRVAVLSDIHGNGVALEAAGFESESSLIGQAFFYLCARRVR